MESNRIMPSASKRRDVEQKRYDDDIEVHPSLSSSSTSTSKNKRSKTSSTSSCNTGITGTTCRRPHPRRKLTYAKDSTVTNDELYKSIEICPVMNVLMQTEVFQRLENIKQLGNAQWIYRGANHNRLQHSLGVAHLAEKMCKSIKEEQPGLNVTPKDVLCVKLAGLFHDLGHGPMSHLYEAFRDSYLPKYLDHNKKALGYYDDCDYQQIPCGWSHEKSSLLFIDALLAECALEIDTNRLDEPLKEINIIEQGRGTNGSGFYVAASSIKAFKPLHNNDVEDRILTSRDFIFIKECIMGSPLDGYDDFVGRRNKKSEFLYDIVNNRHTGLDVDKIDYFARDHTRAIEKVGIEMKMIIDARVAKAECSRPDKCHICSKSKPNSNNNSDPPRMHYMICYPEKRISACSEFFKKRFLLHNIVYQHKTTTAVECMICDILCYADPYLRLRSYNGENFPISRACYKSDFLVRLDDRILMLIDQSSTDDDRLKNARELLRRFKRRDLYKCAVDHSLDVDGSDDRDDSFNVDNHVWKMDEIEIEMGMLEEIKIWSRNTSSSNNEQQQQQQNGDSVTNLKADDFIVKKFCMHHGAGKNNPLLRMRFYDEMSEEKLCGPMTNDEDIPVARQINESKHSSTIPRSFQKVGIRVVVRNDTKRDVVNQLFYQWLERESDRINAANNKNNGQDIPHQCGAGYASPLNIDRRRINYNDKNNGIEFMDDDNNDDNDHQHAALLSQDSDDEGFVDSDCNAAAVACGGQQNLLSPVPVTRRM